MENIWKQNKDVTSVEEAEKKRAEFQVEQQEAENTLVVDDFANSALCFKNLSKQFDGNYAVDRVSLAVPKGSYYGLVGPNGAGKTTTIAMIASLLVPTDGEIYILGQKLGSNADSVRNLIGVMPDGMRLFDRLTGFELLYYNGLLRGLGKEIVTKRANDLLQILGLDEDDKKLVSDYSAGMTKKITLACALIHAPKLLILDEPFEAVDPISANKIQKLLNQYITNGGTIILSSHVMATVEKLCTHVAIMHKGKIISSGTLEQVSNGVNLEERFIESVGVGTEIEELNWL